MFDFLYLLISGISIGLLTGAVVFLIKKVFEVEVQKGC